MIGSLVIILTIAIYCDISDDWNVYGQTMEKLEACALAAIARAQSQTNP